MQTPIIVIDGQELPVDATTAETDENVRQALRGFYPDIMNATITRRTENNRLIITVVKRAGTKGSAGAIIVDLRRIIRRNSKARAVNLSVIKTKDEECRDRFARVSEVLKAAPEELNPAVRLAFELQTGIVAGVLTHAGISLRQKEITEAILAGEREARETSAALDRLQHAPAVSSSQIPVGF